MSSGKQIRPVLEAILCSPDFYEGPRMVKPPIVLSAGLMRAAGRGIENNEWWNKSDRSGQRLYYPPDVSGWNDDRWLDTNTTLGRWELVGVALAGRMVKSPNDATYPAQTGAEALAAARAAWGDPDLTAETAASCWPSRTPSCRPPARRRTSPALRAQRFNALRQLVAASPDYQTC